MKDTIRVEFYGIPRSRAGQSSVAIPCTHEMALGDLLRELVRVCPDLADCFSDGRLTPSVSANLDGDRFVSDPATRLPAGSCLLLLSADAGG